MLTLNGLRPARGAHRKTKRLGRGPGHGRGTQAGKGHKGQKARSGGGVRTGFEGGAMPLYMRLPKKGFTNHRFQKKVAAIGLQLIGQKFQTEEVSRQSLMDKGLLKSRQKHWPIKILSAKEFDRPLVFKGIEKFSKGARQSIERAGGTIS